MEGLGLVMFGSGAKKSATVNPSFWYGRRVFLTGHTGFKGSWLSLWLASMGAKVTGYSLAPNTSPNLYELGKVEHDLERSYIADIRNLEMLKRALNQSKSEIVIHMAAQPLVRYSYANPVETYSTNVMGTVNMLEAIRGQNSVRVVVIVTTDKCYENKEWVWSYRENEPMGGFDPYSNSKGCAELVTSAYTHSFFSPKEFNKHRVAIASARAGNVIGGGDWSDDRLIPDAIKAFKADEELQIRNPSAIRPWQHVLEPLSGYMVLAEALYHQGPKFNGGWNFGPRNEDAFSVQEVINLLVKNLKVNARWKQSQEIHPHEVFNLKLDCSKAQQYLHWAPRWNLEQAIKNIAEWQYSHQKNQDMREISLGQIASYQNY
jgi:CDP-glucose 4,6-dehydratase